MKINNSDYTILIVEDDDVNIFYLDRIISKAGYKTLKASNGSDAIDITLKQNPDLILLDIMMPVMGGFEVIKKLKEIPEKAAIPIIFLSALNSSTDVVKGFEIGAVDYIFKPFNKDELLTRINHQISLIYAKRIISRQTEELKKTIVGRDKLYSVIAHDLRSPIASIRMVMELLINKIPRESLDSDMYDMLMMANQLTDDCFNLLDNLLKWTKSQTGRLNTVFQDNVDIMDIVNGEVDVMRSVAKLKNINITIKGSTERIARLDIDMTKTTVRNLLSNAIKFSYEGSTVEVIISEPSNNVVISVRDFGAGINHEKQHLLFETETHFTSFGTDDEEGSGLGLLLCKEFVKRNGGNIWFESKEGEGSTFSFDIPVTR